MKHLFTAIIIILFLFSCKKESYIKDYSLTNREHVCLTSSILLSTDNNNSYFSDLKIMQKKCIISDSKSDTIFRVFRDNDFSTQLFFTKSDNEYTINPHHISFTSEVKNKSNDILFIDGNYFFNSMVIKNEEIINHRMSTHTDLPHAIDYNISSKYIYGNQKDSRSMYSFYFYSPDSGAYWIRPADKIKKICNDPLVCSNNLCINESKNTLVVAYRYVNFVSLYDLDGELKTTIQIGKDIAKPYIHKDLGIKPEKTKKYFIDTYGTSQYIYCLFSDSYDFSTNSTVFIFKWNGKHVKTLQLDHPISKFAIDEKDSFMICITSNHLGGQDVIRYNL